MMKKTTAVGIVGAAMFIITTALSSFTWGCLHEYHWSFPWATIGRGGPQDTLAIEDFRLWFLMLHVGASLLIAWGIVAVASGLKRWKNKRGPNLKADVRSEEHDDDPKDREGNRAHRVLGLRLLTPTGRASPADPHAIGGDQEGFE